MWAREIVAALWYNHGVSGTWIQAGAAPLVALLILWRGLRHLPRSKFLKWQARFDVQVPPTEEAFVQGRHRRARATRAVMAAIGIVVAGLPSYMNLINAERAGDFANPIVENAWILGAILGTVAAEVLVIQRPRFRSASLHGRRPGDYLDRRWVTWVCLAVPVAVVLAVVSTALETWRWWYGWVGVGGTSIAAGGLLVGLRVITDRAALAPDGELRDIDDALRADGAHHLAGAALALAWMSVAVATPWPLTGWWALVALAIGSTGGFGLMWWWTLARDVRWSVSRARSLS